MVSHRKLSRREAIGAIAAASVLLGMGFGVHTFSGSLEASRRRVSGRSSVIASRFGALEFAVAGSGQPLMMIHGTGGGFDQGLSFAARLAARGHRILAPSRFGYLRSDFPADPSSANQADALVELLDRLGIDRLPVAGGSAGALSAAQLALRHPNRCSGLILLVPAANVSGRDPVEMSAFQELMVEGVLNSDFLYWAALNAVPGRLVGTLLATDPALLARVSPEERRRAYRILEEIMPISARVRGLRNDALLAGSPARMDFSASRVPTLVVSAEDDRFGTAATAREIARAIPDARLVLYRSGGHIWLGHDADVAEAIDQFVGALPRQPAGIPRPTPGPSRESHP
ncbi:MAG: alpha/beta fold hydrolase [Sphingosinicella sp.]|uniref:alpha/beta fold hydrolase n=1 Tax=Sphingosinicella sp. TaxID=1917971 RepID=UPI00403792B0